MDVDFRYDVVNFFIGLPSELEPRWLMLLLFCLSKILRIATGGLVYWIGAGRVKLGRGSRIGLRIGFSRNNCISGAAKTLLWNN